LGKHAAPRLNSERGENAIGAAKRRERARIRSIRSPERRDWLVRMSAIDPTSAFAPHRGTAVASGD
jgi:hypothetical protein